MVAGESWVECEVKLIRDAIDFLLPLDETKPNALVDVEEEFLRTMIDELEGTGLECDHDTGICVCDGIELRNTLVLRLEGKQACSQCKGDGSVWDLATYDAARSRSEFDDPGDVAGYVTCPGCDGRGEVAFP